MGRCRSCRATLPCVVGANWSWSFVTDNTSVRLNFPLTALPATLNNDMSVSVTSPTSIAGQSGASGVRLPPKWRRLMRAPAPAVGDRVEAVQVDHHTRALRVGNRSFVGQGWYVYGSAAMSVETMFQPVRRQAELGVNLIMQYALGSRNASEQLRCAHARAPPRPAQA